MPNLLKNFFWLSINILLSNLKLVNFLSLLIVPNKSEAPNFPKLIKNCSTKIPPLLNTAALIHLPAIDKNNGQLHVRQFSDGSLMIGEGSQESVSNDDSNEHA